MKTIVLLITILCSNLITAQTEATNPNNGVSITVTVNNATNNKGTMLFGLHNATTFMKTEAIQKQHGKIKDGKVTITFTKVSPGEYGIMVLHDENNNNKMDFDLNGMPKEAYGISNNVMSYGPPQFEDAKFTVKHEDIHMEIRL